MMRQPLHPRQQPLDFLRQTKFCINTSRQFVEKEKERKFQNKLTFDYSLNKINKQKLYGRILPTATAMYPRLSYESSRYAAQQYSSPRIRDNRRSFILYKQQPQPQHLQSVKRYSHILTKKKQKQGGLQSFWMFKKQDKTEIKKGRPKNQAQQEAKQQQMANGVQQAFSRVLAWGKLPIDLQSGLISKNLIRNYMASILGESFADWFIKFFQIRSYINFKEFQTLGEKLRSMQLRQTHLVSFFLYDCNGDSYICPRDVFAVFQRQLDASIEQDVLEIAHFAACNEGKGDEVDEQFKIEHVVIRDNWLTLKDYELYFKKVDQPYLSATNKKDTGFAKTFAVLDHREKVRSTRREINQKKVMYNGLFGQIARERKINAYVEQQDYRLNYTFLHQIFRLHPTNLFIFFCNRIMGVLPLQ